MNPDYTKAAEDYAIQKHKSMVYMQAHQAKESFIAGCEFASAPLLEQIEKQQAQIKELTAEFDKVIMGNINYGALRLELQSMKTELKKVEEWESVKEVDRLKRELITKQEEINKNKEAYDLAMSFEKAGWYKSDEFEKLTEQIEKLKEENERVHNRNEALMYDVQIRNESIARRIDENTVLRQQLSNATNRTLEEKELIKDIWSLWDSLAECGEIHIGPNFSKRYDELKIKINEKTL